MENLTKELNVYLSTQAVLYLKLQNLHYNVVGDQFFDAHEKSEEYYRVMAEQIDEIAEELLSLKQKPLANMSEYLKNSLVEERGIESLSGVEVFEIITKDFEILNNQARKAYNLAVENNVITTKNILESYIKEYDKKIWMTSAYIAK